MEGHESREKMTLDTIKTGGQKQIIFEYLQKITAFKCFLSIIKTHHYRVSEARGRKEKETFRGIAMLLLLQLLILLF